MLRIPRLLAHIALLYIGAAGAEARAIDLLESWRAASVHDAALILWFDGLGAPRARPKLAPSLPAES